MTPLLTADDLARLLATSTEQVRNMRKRGQLPAPLRVPGLGYRWRAESIAAWLATAERRAP